MPLKAPTAGDSLDSTSVLFLLTTLKNAAELAVDWKAVAREHDIKHAYNARPRFNAIVAKFGFKLEGNKIIQLCGARDDAGTISAGTISTPKAKGKKAAAVNTPASKKRNMQEEADDEKLKEGSEEDDGNGGASQLV